MKAMTSVAVLGLMPVPPEIISDWSAMMGTCSPDAIAERMATQDELAGIEEELADVDSKQAPAIHIRSANLSRKVDLPAAWGQCGYTSDEPLGPVLIGSARL